MSASSPTGQQAERDLEALATWINERPMTSALRFRCREIEYGRAVFEFAPPDEWRNPDGSLPGAMLMALADHSSGFAASSITDEDDYVTTVDLGLHFVRPAFDAPVTSETLVLRGGQSLVFLRTEVRDPDGALVATGHGSFAVRAGKGREHRIGPDRTDD